MARKRQRAKERKQKLHRENVPGSLDHASGEVEGVEATIVAGAGGRPVAPEDDLEHGFRGDGDGALDVDVDVEDDDRLG